MGVVDVVVPDGARDAAASPVGDEAGFASLDPLHALSTASISSAPALHIALCLIAHPAIYLRASLSTAPSNVTMYSSPSGDCPNAVTWTPVSASGIIAPGFVASTPQILPLQ